MASCCNHTLVSSSNSVWEGTHVPRAIMRNMTWYWARKLFKGKGYRVPFSRLGALSFRRPLPAVRTVRVNRVIGQDLLLLPPLSSTLPWASFLKRLQKLFVKLRSIHLKRLILPHVLKLRKEKEWQGFRIGNTLVFKIHWEFEVSEIGPKRFEAFEKSSTWYWTRKLFNGKRLKRSTFLGALWFSWPLA